MDEWMNGRKASHTRPTYNWMQINLSHIVCLLRTPVPRKRRENGTVVACILPISGSGSSWPLFQWRQTPNEVLQTSAHRLYLYPKKNETEKNNKTKWNRTNSSEFFRLFEQTQMCWLLVWLVGRDVPSVWATCRRDENNNKITYRFHSVPSFLSIFFFFSFAHQSFTCRNDNANKNEMFFVFAVSIRFVFCFLFPKTLFPYSDLIRRWFSSLNFFVRPIRVVEIEIICHWTRNV